MFSPFSKISFLIFVLFQCAQYIGEIARYLYATPESPYEKQHSVRMMFGNGLRPQIWQQFVDRFNIPQICEFYGSTEGNCSVGNFSNKLCPKILNIIY